MGEGNTATKLSGKDKLKALFGKNGTGTAMAGLGLSMLGSYLSLSAAGMGEDTQDERNSKANRTLLGSIASGAGMGAMLGPYGAIIGGIGGLIVGAI